MKISDRTYFAILITSIFAVLIVILVSLAHYLPLFYPDDHLVILLLCALVIIVLSFFLIRHLVENYIYKKVRVIYKTIHQFKKSSYERKRPSLGNNAIEQVNKEVIKWQQDKDNQIARLKLRAQYRREFIGNVSHELKTPIFTIQGYVLTLLDGGLDDPSINKKYLEKTEHSINRMISIVEDLEDISQLESGNLTLNIEKFNVVEIAQECVDQLEMKANKRNIKIYFRKKNEKSIRVKGDSKRIRQVFINLIDNAIKYGKENGSIKISFFDMDDHILCEVTDDGPGISNEALPRVFERFYRAGKDRARISGGSGLGLAIVKHIIEAHNQKINVRSKLGIGTTFAFTLKKV